MTPQALVGWAIVGSMHLVGVAMLLALYRLLRGPTVPDRILALDTLFVAAIAELMLFGMHLGTAVYFEAALVIAMLGFVGTVVLSKYVLRRDIVATAAVNHLVNETGSTFLSRLTAATRAGVSEVVEAYLEADRELGAPAKRDAAIAKGQPSEAENRTLLEIEEQLEAATRKALGGKKTS